MTTKVIFIIFILISISFFGCNKEIKYMLLETNPEKDGLVPDERTAIKIAEAVWLPVYGYRIEEFKPYIAELKGDSIWVVFGSLPDSMYGGTPQMEIYKKDGKIINFGHGK